MSFTVWHDAASAVQALDTACKPIRLGGQEAAFKCVACIPACMWSVEIASPRLCSISPTSPSDTLQLEIAKTVQFEAPAGANPAPVETMAQPTLTATGNMRDAGIYVSNYSIARPKQFPSNTITAYTINSTGNEKPGAVIVSFDHARGIAVDSRGYIYTANEGTYAGWPSVKVYPPTDRGLVQASASISGSTVESASDDVTGLHFPSGIAIDSAGNMYVTDDNGTVNAGGRNVDSVIVYERRSNGNAKPSLTIAGPDTGLRDPKGIAIDEKGNIFVVNSGECSVSSGDCSSGSGSITIYRPGSNGNAKPVSTIRGPNTGLYDPAGIAVDCGGNIYVANYEGGPLQHGSITIYGSGSDGNSKPARTIVGDDTRLRQPYGVALDSDRNIYAANYVGGPIESGSVSVYSAGSDGDAKPLRVIAGPDTGLDHPWGIATRPSRCSR
jgi:hypothetical protein